MPPEGVERLQLTFHPELPLSLHHLPRTLQQLQLETNFESGSFEGSFTSHLQLRQLTLSGELWSGPLEPHWLPPALLELNLEGTASDSPLVRHALPPTLRKLVLSRYYGQPFTSDSFASCQQLEELSLPRYSFKQLLTGVAAAAAGARRVPRGAAALSAVCAHHHCMCSCTHSAAAECSTSSMRGRPRGPSGQQCRVWSWCVAAG